MLPFQKLLKELKLEKTLRAKVDKEDERHEDLMEQIDRNIEKLRWKQEELDELEE